ncbi:hypothetical protein DL769_008640 [Monosporascus sp. CRB-8-3]|nr:hypothetical protein DL769_008640 [Monosporascus sp. CRB-8-3]
MASKSVRDGCFVQPPPILSDISDPEDGAAPDGRRKRRKREANVYDAVAGRVTSTLPLDDDASDSDAASTRHRRPARGDQHRDPTLAPEEVLFRRIGAPVRFAEKDIYHAHEALPHGGRDVLPDSDLVRAVHSYTSHFYAALAARQRRGDSGPRGSQGRESRRADRGVVDEQSMDETALLAFGILLEEAGREVLGKRGDLVFTEGVEVDGNGEPRENDVGLGPIGFNEARRWRRQPPQRASKSSQETL